MPTLLQVQHLTLPWQLEHRHCASPQGTVDPGILLAARGCTSSLPTLSSLLMGFSFWGRDGQDPGSRLAAGTC